MKTFFLAEKIALAYCIGIGLLTLEMAALSLLGIQFSIVSLTVCMALSVAAVLLVTHRPDKLQARVKMQPLSGLEKFFILGISFEVLYAFFRTLIMPMESYDGIAIYALKSKIFYLARSIPHDFFSSFGDFVPHVEYPLLIPLAEAAFYTFLGTVNDLLVKVIFPLYYLSLVIVFYSVSRRFISRRQSLLFTFLLATIPQVTDFATNGYADLPFAFYCSAAVFYLYLWMTQKKDPFLVLSCILSLLAIWTKSEGLMFAFINAVVMAVYMFRERIVYVKCCVYTAFMVVMAVTYMIILNLLGLAVNSDFISYQSSLPVRLVMGAERIPAILYEYQIQFFGPKRWNIIWILFIAGFFLGFKKAFSKDMIPLTETIILIFFGYSAVYMLSSAPQGFGWHLSTSGSRLFIHFVPIVVLWLVLLFKKLELDV